MGGEFWSFPPVSFRMLTACWTARWPAALYAVRVLLIVRWRFVLLVHGLLCCLPLAASHVRYPVLPHHLASARVLLPDPHTLPGVCRVLCFLCFVCIPLPACCFVGAFVLFTVLYLVLAVLDVSCLCSDLYCTPDSYLGF